MPLLNLDSILTMSLQSEEDSRISDVAEVGGPYWVAYKIFIYFSYGPCKSLLSAMYKTTYHPKITNTYLKFW